MGATTPVRTDEAMVEVQGLRRRFGDFELRLDHLRVERGQHYCLLGPSGSGKTVTLESIAGHHHLETGEVYLAGQRATHWPADRRSVGLLYQDGALFPHLSVWDNVAFGLRCQHMSCAERGRRVREVAEWVGLGELLSRPSVRGLSGGEARRVALARTLAPGPPLLLLDEPCSWLDRPQREQLAELLRRLTSELAATVIHVTHDFGEAAAVCDVAGLVLDGELRQSGPLAEILRRPRDLAAARFLGITNCFPVTGRDGRGAPAALGHTWAVDGPVPDRPAWLMFRPEDLTISLQTPTAENAIEATVHELIDRADFVQVGARRHGQQINGYISHAAFRELHLQLGQTVTINVRPGACHVIA